MSDKLPLPFRCAGCLRVIGYKESASPNPEVYCHTCKMEKEMGNR